MLTPLWLAALLALAAAAGLQSLRLWPDLRPGPLAIAATLAVPALAALALAPDEIGPAHALWTACLVALLAPLGLMDALSRSLADLLSGALAATGLLHAAFFPGAFWPALVAVAATLVLALATARLSGARGHIGSGDGLFLAGVMAWLGPGYLADLLALGAFFLALTAVVHFMRRPGEAPQAPAARLLALPLAPALGLAALSLWLGGPIL